MSLQFQDLRVKNVIRCEKSFHALHAWSPTDWGCALAGEVGEACDKVKKLRRLESWYKPEDVTKRDVLVEEIADELADVIIYADLLAARLDIDLGEAVRKKFNVVSVRYGSEIKL